MRAITLFSKAVALLFLARVLAPQQLGIYGLFASTIAYSVFILGMEFYTFSTREFLKQDGRDAARCIRDQAVFHLALYAVLFPSLGAVFYYGYLPFKYIIWFYLILGFEHIFRELYRILVALMRPIAATAVFFLASGFWPWLAVPAMVLSPGLRSLSTVWVCWFLSQAMGLVCAAWFLRHLHWRQAFSRSVDWEWIYRGIRAAAPLLGASLSLSAITTLDRYFIKHYLDDAMLGFYAFFANIAYAVFAFLDSGVVSIYYPKIVRSFQDGRFADYRTAVGQLAKGMVIGLLSLVTVSVLGIFPLLSILHRPIYTQHVSVYWIMLAVVSVWSLGLIPHYALYAKRRDTAIVCCNFVGLLTSLLGYSALIRRYGIDGAALAVLTGMVTIAVLKACCLVLFEGKTKARSSSDDVSSLNIEIEGAL